MSDTCYACGATDHLHAWGFAATEEKPERTWHVCEECIAGPPIRTTYSNGQPHAFVERSTA